METQLKYLQIVTPLVTNNKDYSLHGDLLAKVNFKYRLSAVRPGLQREHKLRVARGSVKETNNRLSLYSNSRWEYVSVSKKCPEVAPL